MLLVLLASSGEMTELAWHRREFWLAGKLKKSSGSTHEL
jgi:hypothetical protein